MSNIDIIRAWKDEEYRHSLTEEQRSQLPENPAGIIEMSDGEMENVAGGGGIHATGNRYCASLLLCPSIAVDSCPTNLICGSSKTLCES